MAGREGEEGSGWLLFRASQGPVLWAARLDMALHSQDHGFPSIVKAMPGPGAGLTTGREVRVTSWLWGGESQA